MKLYLSHEDSVKLHDMLGEQFWQQHRHDIKMHRIKVAIWGLILSGLTATIYLFKSEILQVYYDWVG